MNWFGNNLPAISSSFVAIVSVLISLIKLIRENDASSKKIQRLINLFDAYEKAPSNLRAKKDMEDVLNIKTEEFKNILTRKVNWSNVVAVTVVSLIGGLISYFLSSWAIGAPPVWSFIAWTLFGLVAFFTIGIAIAGLASTYKHDDEKEKL